MDKAPNNIIHHLFNKSTYSKTIANANIKANNINPNDISPLWITGMFRSGTSITTQILKEMGINLGPENDLLQAKGERAKLNPNGFFENYLFMDWSMVVFDQLNAWGDNPPTTNSVKNFDNASIKYEQFVYDSIVNIHDDRISNKDKSRILKQYFAGNLAQYVKDNFQNKFAIKNPHFSVLYPALDQLFPKGKYLIVFRNPTDTIQSAKKITPNANFKLYHQYYAEILNHPNAIFFNYDKLIASPKESISQLAHHLNLTCNIEQLTALIKQNSISKTEAIPQHVLNLHKELIKKAIN